jgi:uncharacterized membrane protein YphA (DoxX/SURF4 family)
MKLIDKTKNLLDSLSLKMLAIIMVVAVIIAALMTVAGEITTIVATVLAGLGFVAGWFF